MEMLHASKLMDASRIKFRLIIDEKDLPTLEWDGEYAHFRRLYREIFKAAQDGKVLMWVVELEGGGIIGQVFVQLVSARIELANGNDRAYLYSFRIKPSYRGQGIGTQLLRIVELDLVERAYLWATLNIARDNPSALRFYVRNGYKKVASESGYWTYQDEKGRTHEVYEPAWRMQKKLVVGKAC